MSETYSHFELHGVAMASIAEYWTANYHGGLKLDLANVEGNLICSINITGAKDTELTVSYKKHGQKMKLTSE